MRLSVKALGVLIRILSYPDDWRIDHRSLAQLWPKEGTTLLRSAFKELREAGYIVQVKHRGDDGRWITETVVHDSPQDPGADEHADTSPQVAPSVGYPRPADAHPEDPHLYRESDRVSGTELNRPALPSSARRDEFEDWRTKDRELFKSIIGDAMTSDGDRWRAGTYSAEVWYETLHQRKPKPIKWPGRLVSKLDDNGTLHEYLAALGLEPAA